jgi:hypothetical protein
MSIFDELKKPFPPSDVEWRLSSKSKDKKRGQVLAYITARGVQERLDEVVGPENWSISYRPADLGVITQSTYNGDKSVPVKGFLAELTVYVGDKVITRVDGSNCTDFEPFKGGLSGALKRAASALGIGRYLYKLPPTWVPIDNYGNFKNPQLPEWALPEGFQYPHEYHSEEAETPHQYHGSEDPAPSFDAEQQGPIGPVTMPRGKFAGKPVAEITDYGYLDWIVNKSSFEADIKEAAAAALKKRMDELEFAG